ncbi:MAG: endonuclease III [Deinococcales bacterium]
MQTRALNILEALNQIYPNARTELDYQDSFQLLIATILSAQATDKSVNAATPALFERYSDAFSLAEAQLEEVESFIRSIGLYQNKAKNIIKSAQILVKEHAGTLPNDFDALLKLPGVGRKTANVVLSNAYNRPAIAVDTHVGRLARRLGLSEATHPDKVEKDLEALFPQEQWIFSHHALILHGRRVCTAKKPDCKLCRLALFCPSFPID